MESLLGYTKDELKDLAKEYGQPQYRGEQLYKWLNIGADYGSMSDIPLRFREQLSDKFLAQPLKTVETIESSDGSKKLLYRLSDGNVIEGIYMPHGYGNTLCVSTQVGCRMGCAFCASGIGGLVRNLDAAEILGQVVAVNAALGATVKERKLSNVVLMGSGEPLDNYEQVTKFIRLITAEGGLNMGQRSISLSTCGLADKIIQLADDGYGVTLSLSLHATTDEIRKELMPIANRYTLKQTVDAVKYYFEKTGRRVIFEYSMIKGKNIDFFDAKRLKELTKGYPCHVNLIKLNYVKEKNLSGCTDEEAKRFLKRLEDLGVSATLRRSLGGDVGGACGQLRRRYLEKESLS